MIAGGGRVGLRLARSLIDQCEVKIIERDAARCEYLASQLPSSTLVLHGDGADEDLLRGENVGMMDMFLALTSDDEDNIMSAMLAKRLGAGRVLSLINRRAYADMMQGSTIDIAISPAQTVIGELLAHLRRGDVAAVLAPGGVGAGAGGPVRDASELGQHQLQQDPPGQLSAMLGEADEGDQHGVFSSAVGLVDGVDEVGGGVMAGQCRLEPPPLARAGCSSAG